MADLELPDDLVALRLAAEKAHEAYAAGVGTDQADQLRQEAVEASLAVWRHPLVTAAREREEGAPQPEDVDRAMWKAVHSTRAVAAP